MRRLTYLMFVGSLIFAFILLQEHYGIADRLWEYRSTGTVQPDSKAAPAGSGWSLISGDHDYQVIIDISGKGPFVSVIHRAAPNGKKAPKPAKKIVAAKQTAPKDESQPTAQLPAQPAPPTPDVGAKTQ